MKKRRKPTFSIAAKILLAVVIVFTIFKPISLQIQIRDLQKQSAALDDAIDEKEVVNKDLKDSLEEGVTDESIAKIARDVLGYASPGERVFIDSSEQ
ncbi:MAG: septum formation initiator family protein [Butyricicoccus sp.]|nr:septum formation initiator family protein [Clostridiales bacterium]